MLVNNIDITVYKAKLLSKSIQTNEITIYDDWLRKALNPLYLGKQETFKSITMQFVIADTTDNACLLDISNFVTQLAKCTVKFDDIDFYYDCTLVSKQHSQLIETGYFGLDVELKAGYAYLAEVTETMDHVASKTITVLGNLPTPAVVTVVPSIDTISAVISGATKSPILIKNLYLNNPITIDGEKYTITEQDFDFTITIAAGVGKWAYRQYNMWNFANPDEANVPFAPKYEDIPVGTPYTHALVPDSAILVANAGYDYLGHAKTAIYVTSPIVRSFTFHHDDGASVYLNGVLIYSGIGVVTPTPSIVLNLVAGWNILEILVINHFGPGYISNITPIIGSMVEQLNCYYSRAIAPQNSVNKFGDTDMWEFPTLQPGVNTIDIDILTADVQIKYKPKFL